MKWGIRRYQPYPSDYRGSGKEIGEAARATRLEADKKTTVKVAKKNAQAAYTNIKSNVMQVNKTEKRMEKGKTISEKEQSRYKESKKVVNQSMKEIDKATQAIGYEAVNKAIRNQQFKDNFVGSVIGTAGYNAGLAVLASQGIVFPTPRVIPIMDVKAGQATKYINQHRS